MVENPLDFLNRPHRRYNPLMREGVLVSPQRTQRPWQGQVEKTGDTAMPTYDPDCYLCPTNSRAGGKKTPDYQAVYIFDNDFPSLVPETPPAKYEQAGLLKAESERGIARVICFSPRHDLTLAKMGPSSIRPVVDAWAAQYQELAQLEFINYIQTFENRGAMMGASNPHPHGQLWGTEHIPDIPARELMSQADYQRARGKCLLCSYLELEVGEGTRLVCQNDSWVAVVPFWAVWPFETLVTSRAHLGKISDLDEKQRDNLAEILNQLTIRYDNLFETSFPYSMGFHQTPSNGKAYPSHHLHAHFLPPLLRSSSIRKFMVGFELLANPQRDITPETSAERLRALPAIHY